MGTVDDLNGEAVVGGASANRAMDEVEADEREQSWVVKRERESSA